MKNLLLGMVIGGLLTSPPHSNSKPAAVQEHGLIGSTKLDQPLPAKLAGYKFHVTEAVYKPGGYVGNHRHVGPGVRVIVKGTLAFEQGGKTTLYHAGDVYYESGATVHSASNHTRKLVQVVNVEILPATFNGPTLIRPDTGRGL